ncbi:LysE family translocator [Marinicella litoralis]|uniref:Threonine/homoserine/homoserine lactone efflux protein n=1 Tax=Marinicella litoralis TaxID=644220 RepID=A0A4R6XM09_9GAMM|nr:LysE family translocator [Marinicella litoralis]TDR20682.1 threonine/homoserine/homoserine lactone efflux protein [Marinicella litoralis]
MSSGSLLALFGAMLIVALVPGPAVLAVIARTFSSGFSRGLMMIIGITLGDFIFILLALFGLSIISEILGTTFLIIKYASAAYLIWLGISLFKSKSSAEDIKVSKESSLLANLITGLMINLGNPKAIVFYIGLFPAFIDVNQVVTVDVMTIMGIATIAFGSVNICYALLALRAKKMLNNPDASSLINKTAGTIMVSTGALVAIKA